MVVYFYTYPTYFEGAVAFFSTSGFSMKIKKSKKQTAEEAENERSENLKITIDIICRAVIK